MYPRIEGCETCEAMGQCICWDDADQREFEHEFQEGIDAADELFVSRFLCQS